MAMGRGETFQIISFWLIVIGVLSGLAGLFLGFWVFWLCLIGGLCGLAGRILGFWGSRISGRGNAETVGLLKTNVEAARKRQEPVWTPFERVEAVAGICPLAQYAIIQFRLWSDDNTVRAKLDAVAKIQTDIAVLRYTKGVHAIAATITADQKTAMGLIGDAVPPAESVKSRSTM